jgi:hypothetical protein
VVFIPGKTGNTSTVVKYIAKFDDYSDITHPFMYHCHIALHEDEGMMGQFVVSDTAASTDVNAIKEAGADFSIFPNPANSRLFVAMQNNDTNPYYIRITNLLGQTMYMLPQPDLANGIDISRLKNGMYFLQLTSDPYKKPITKSFVKE